MFVVSSRSVMKPEASKTLNIHDFEYFMLNTQINKNPFFNVFVIEVNEKVSNMSFLFVASLFMGIKTK